ncbi:hypothetical protein [Rhodopirellula halodulae]|nr:hypothetical protein [Rhodopirellula sp. JC737]
MNQPNRGSNILGQLTDMGYKITMLAGWASHETRRSVDTET